MSVLGDFLRAVPKDAGLAFLAAGAVPFLLTFAFLALPMEEDTLGLPAENGGQLCGTSLRPGPLARVAGPLFILAWLLPVAGLSVLGAHAEGVTARNLFWLATAILAALLLMSLFYVTVTTL